MSFTYAIGDLHGRDDVLEACLKRIEAHRRARGDETGEDTNIVFLGDYIDRGKQSKKVIERLMVGATDKSNWIILKGNHEMMACMAHADRQMYWKWWCDNGGLATAMNYPERTMYTDHLLWMNRLPDRYKDDHRLFVHAGVKKDLPLHLQTTDMVVWVRHKRDEEVPLPAERQKNPLYVVHGHTPYLDGPVVLETRCNLDTGSYQTGKASIAVFDDEVAGQPLEMLTVSAGYNIDPDDWQTW